MHIGVTQLAEVEVLLDGEDLGVQLLETSVGLSFVGFDIGRRSAISSKVFANDEAV